MIPWTNDELQTEICLRIPVPGRVLTIAQMDSLRWMGHSLESAIGVAHDVSVGYDFDITARANVPKPNQLQETSK